MKAKFKITAITLHGSSREVKNEKGETVIEGIVMRSVYAGIVPGGEVHESSPNAQLTITCIDEALAARFEVGKECQIEVSPA